LSLAVLLAVMPLRAEDETPPPPQPVKGSDGKPLRDPTQLSPRMREMLAPKKESSHVEVQKAPPPKLPQIILRGLVAAAEGDGSAAIEIKGGSVYLVRAGSTVQAPVDNQTLTLQIKSIGKDAITIEIVELQQTLTIR
jgi:hypothetical protein